MSPHISYLQDHNDIAAQVHSSGGITRIITGFEAADVLYISGQHPTAFRLVPTTNGQRVDPTSVLIELANGERIAVDRVSVGYPGEGPRDVRRLFAALGVDRDLVEALTRNRFCDLRFEGGRAVGLDFSMIWPICHLGRPEVIDGRLVVVVPRGGLSDASTRAPDPSGFNASPSGLSTYGNWIAALDQAIARPVPQWMLGERSARLFLDREEAAAQGYEMNLEQGRGMLVPAMVITQGDLEVWVDLPEAPEGKLVDEQGYEAIEEAGFDASMLREHDNASWLRRWWNGNRELAPVVELSPLR